MPYRKKLIEVSLPLEAINAESAREKSIRHGHPSTLHLWWARRPLAACRAVLWSSLVDDPSEYMPDEGSANRERERLFAILEKLVKWENINNEDVLDAAKLEIARSVARDLGCEVPVGKQAINEFLATKAPPVLDPFAGGGSIPLEAQRLGLRAYASDLNPVAVLINKALIEIPPKFAGMPPVHPPEEGTTPGKKGKKTAQAELWDHEWKGAEGLAEDVRYYGKWMRDEAEKKIGLIYPKVKITSEMLVKREDLRKEGLKAGDELTVIAWLWTRKVKCPNPACGTQMPLIRSFTLSSKNGKRVWIEPRILKGNKESGIQFSVRTGDGQVLESTVGRNGAKCLTCGTPVELEYIRSEGRSNRIDTQMIALVVEFNNRRLYLDPLVEHENLAKSVKATWKPNCEIPKKHRNFQTPAYGMLTIGDLFTSRQLVILTTLADLVKEAYEKIRADCIAASRLQSVGVNDYASSLATILGLGVSRSANTLCSLAIWSQSRNQSVNVFSRQALPMTWDYPEVNPFGGAAGDFSETIESISTTIVNVPTNEVGVVTQADATKVTVNEKIILATDPPYYDNISYAELSDFFYVWLRRSLGQFYPNLFGTLSTPKIAELISAPHRHNYDTFQADKFFEEGLRSVFSQMTTFQHVSYPSSIYYAFKQVETDVDDINGVSTPTFTGWETMLEGLLHAKLSINGTWPMRTERPTGVKVNMNALASSIVLICRPRSEDAPTATRRDFLISLKRELPPALRQLQLGNIAPVDLAQAAIGPGMAIFSRYKSVLEANGTSMRIRAALALINQALDEFLAEQEGEYDSDTRWALAWFEQYGHEQGPYGVAETLSKAKNTSVEGLSHAGFLESRAGKVRLLKRDELDAEWDPAKDKRLTAWEATQYLIRTLDKEGEKGAGALLGKLGSFGETARDLAYRLYTICERKGWAQEALAYNMLVVAWPRIKEQAGKGDRQERML